MQLLEALEWCLEMGIFCVSVYAFSIDNFKRPPQEVAMLMQLAEEKLEELLQVGRSQMQSLPLAQALCLGVFILAILMSGRRP